LGEPTGKRTALILEPSAKPSKVWWKEMATRNTIKAVPVATERAIPMKMEWKRIPASKRRHCNSSFLFWASVFSASSDELPPDPWV
jgi:hypothetical protein